MIKSFRHRGLKRFFVDDDAKLLNPDYVARIKRQLDALHTSDVVGDMNFPGYQLHELKGNRKGTWSVQVSGNWRITFQFQDGDAYHVNLEDYH